MRSFMSDAIRALGFRSIALRLAAKSPLLTAIGARVLMFIAAVTVIVATMDVVAQGFPSSELIKVPIGFLSFLLAYAMLGAAKEIHCRRNGLPVHPW
jgi:hypothetical protein